MSSWLQENSPPGLTNEEAKTEMGAVARYVADEGVRRTRPAYWSVFLKGDRGERGPPLGWGGFE